MSKFVYGCVWLGNTQTGLISYKGGILCHLLLLNRNLKDFGLQRTFADDIDRSKITCNFIKCALLHALRW